MTGRARNRLWSTPALVTGATWKLLAFGFCFSSLCARRGTFDLPIIDSLHPYKRTEICDSKLNTICLDLRLAHTNNLRRAKPTAHCNKSHEPVASYTEQSVHTRRKVRPAYSVRQINSVDKKHLKNVGPIRHCEPPYAHSPGVATVARAHRCPRRRQQQQQQRQRVTEGIAMSPWNGPNNAIQRQTWRDLLRVACTWCSVMSLLSGGRSVRRSTGTTLILTAWGALVF